jgi:hypothetical protein
MDKKTLTVLIKARNEIQNIYTDIDRLNARVGELHDIIEGLCDDR